MTTLSVHRFARCVGLVASACLIAGVTAFAAETLTYSYDANGRLLKADFGSGKVSTYVYDKAGNIVTAASQSPDNTLRVFISPLGAGGVAGGNIACPGTCVHAFPGSQQVTLSASPQLDLKLLAWGGDLYSTANPFVFTLDTDRNLTAYFGATSGSTDSDGVPDTVEMGPTGADPGFDGNDDGIPDYQQANAASFPMADGRGYATLAVPPANGLTNVAAVSNPHPEDAPAMSFPYGFFAFTVTGVGSGGVIATLFLPKNAAIVDYYKYGPTPDNTTPHWYRFSLSGATGAEIVQNAGDTRILLHMFDAQRGDDVLSVDGQVVDVGGPAAEIAPAIHLDPAEAVFTEAPANTARTVTLTVSNTGNADLVIGAVGEGNGLAAPFSIAGETCSGLTLQPQPAGGTCTITVRFAPSAVGHFTDSLTIPSNDPMTNPFIVAVEGDATAAEPIPVSSGIGLALLAALLAGIALKVLGRQ